MERISSRLISRSCRLFRKNRIYPTSTSQLSPCFCNSIYYQNVIQFHQQGQGQEGQVVEPEEERIVDDDGRGGFFTKNVHPYKNLYPWKSKAEFAQYLIENIVYNDDGLLALYKPYGVGVRIFDGSQNRNKSSSDDFNLIGEAPYTIEDALPYIKLEYKNPHLRIVKSFEKLTSSMTIFAQDEKTEDKFKKSVIMTKPLKIQAKTFHVVCRNLRATDNKLRKQTLLNSEKIGVTLVQNSDKTSKQPKIVRDYSLNSRKDGSTLVANIVSKVLDSNHQNDTVLLEIQLNTTKWNLVRLYCTDILLPILGDHLFANRIGSFLGNNSKLAPFQAHPTFQKLPLPLLKSLGLKDEQDSLIIPPMIHLHSFTLPNFKGKNGSNLTIMCKPPVYFPWTCEKLGLTTGPGLLM